MIATSTEARILLTRLQILAARVYPESQCGFRTGRSTIDMIFSVHHLQEKYKEQGKPLYLAFIDMTKAFDLVSRKGLFHLLEKIGCPLQMRGLVVSFHKDIKSTVLFDGSCSEHLRSLVESNNAACWHQHCSGFSFPYSRSMPLTPLQMASTYTPAPMESSSTWLV